MTDRELMQMAMHDIFVARLLRERLSQPDHLRDATKKVWVGLTAKDLAEIPPSCYEGAIWADAKLKEKNDAA